MKRCGTEIIIVGGGIMGVCASYFLSLLGHEVMLIERKAIGVEASGRNAGSVALQNKRHHLLPLCLRGLATWRELDQSVEGLEFSTLGGMRVAETDEEVAVLDRDLEAQNRLGLEVYRMTDGDVQNLAPYLAHDLKAVNYCPEDSIVDALLSTSRIANAARQTGAELLCHSNVRKIRWIDSSHVEVDTKDATIRGQKLILTAGAWTREVAGLLGVHIPVRPKINQMLVTCRVPPLIHHMLSHANGRLTLKQVSCGSVLIGGGWQGRGGMEQDTAYADLSSSVGNAQVATRVVPALSDLEVIRTWAGFDSRTPDEYPVIGPLPGKENTLVGASCIGGYVAGPYVGKLLAQLVHEGKTELDLRPYHQERFLHCSQAGGVK